MRSFRCALALKIGCLFVAASVSPAHGATVKVTHFGPIPCAVLCAHWDVTAALGYEECRAPFPEGSYDYSVFRLTATTGIVHISAPSPIDHDSFVCTNTDPPVLVFSVAADHCEPIGGRVSVLRTGCLEEGELTYNALLATNGGENEMEFRVVTYNWSDVSAIDIVLRGPVEVVADDYEPECPAGVC